MPDPENRRAARRAKRATAPSEQVEIRENYTVATPVPVPPGRATPPTQSSQQHVQRGDRVEVRESLVVATPTPLPPPPGLRAPVSARPAMGSSNIPRALGALAHTVLPDDARLADLQRGGTPVQHTQVSRQAPACSCVSPAAFGVGDEYIARLRAWVRPLGDAIDYVSYIAPNSADYFKAAYSHYLPKRLINHYYRGTGRDFFLTEQMMRDISPVHLAVRRSEQFQQLLAELKKPPLQPGGRQNNPPRQAPFEGTSIAGARENGTLGHFTVRWNGVLAYDPWEHTWVFSGTMSFFDVWDFNPSDHRNIVAETKVWAARNLLSGRAFNVTSAAVTVRQDDRMDEVDWASTVGASTGTVDDAD